MHVRLVADEAGDTEPVPRRVPAAAAQLRRGTGVKGTGTGGIQDDLGVQGTG